MPKIKKVNMDYIFDIDNTLSDDAHRKPILASTDVNKWDTYYSMLVADTPILQSVATLQALYNDGHNIIICTGRPDKYREPTIKWLDTFGIQYSALYMRYPELGTVKNAVAKAAMLVHIIKDGYNPVAVFEDNPLSANMWKDNGLIVYQVV
jgi:hypothetical protein